jgi:PAH dioxygenase large subunit
MTIEVLSEKKREDGEFAHLLEDAELSLNDNLVPLWLLADPRVFDLENQKLWSRVWSFLAHESEIPQPGDYVVRNIGTYDSVILIRDEEGTVHALSNICAHRGMRICRADLGNTSHFRCPYHGWTYSSEGKLIGIPYRTVAYADEPILEKYSEGLKRIRIDTYNGFIFGSLDGDIEPLSSFLGDFRWYLDLVSKRTPEGLIFYPPLRHVSNFNWKIAAENFACDSYHVKTTHRWAISTQTISDKPFGGVQVAINGHAINCNITEGNPRTPIRYPEFWPQLTELSEKNLAPGQFTVLKKTMTLFGNVFPNLSFINTSQGNVPFLTFRTWKPIAPDKTEFCTWFAVEKEAPEDFKKKSYAYYIQQHGIAGAFEVDDVEIWKYITANSRSNEARKVKLNCDVGFHTRSKVADWPGPGKVAGHPNEMAAVEFWKKVLEHLRN